MKGARPSRQFLCCPATDRQLLSWARGALGKRQLFLSPEFPFSRALCGRVNVSFHAFVCTLRSSNNLVGGSSEQLPGCTETSPRLSSLHPGAHSDADSRLAGEAAELPPSHPQAHGQASAEQPRFTKFGTPGQRSTEC